MRTGREERLRDLRPMQVKLQRKKLTELTTDNMERGTRGGQVGQQGKEWEKPKVHTVFSSLKFRSQTKPSAQGTRF